MYSDKENVGNPNNSSSSASICNDTHPYGYCIVGPLPVIADKTAQLPTTSGANHDHCNKDNDEKDHEEEMYDLYTDDSDEF